MATMAKILLVNCSSRYNLGLAKAEAYHRARGDEVTWANRVDLLAAGADMVYLSALFTWNLPALVENARRACDMGLQVEVGGPAAELNAGLVKRETGVAPWSGRHPCDAFCFSARLARLREENGGRSCGALCMVFSSPSHVNT